MLTPVATVVIARAGSDRPAGLLDADHARAHAPAADFVARHCSDHADAVLGGNARAAYRR